MSGAVYPHIFEEMVNQDIEWLKQRISEDEQSYAYGEYEHIVQCLKYCCDMYRQYGYDEQMRTNDA